MGSLLAPGHADRVQAKKNQARSGEVMKRTRDRKLASHWSPVVGDVVGVVIPVADRTPMGAQSFPAKVVELKVSGARLRCVNSWSPFVTN